MNNDQGTKLFLALLLTTSFIFSFSQFGAKAYQHFFQRASGYGGNTKIAAIDAAGMNESEVLKALVTKQADWEKTNAITIKYKEKTKKVETDLFDFQLQDSVSKMKQGIDNQVLVSIDEEKWKSFLNSISPEIVEEDAFYLNKLNDSLLAIAAGMQTGDSLLDVNDYRISKKEEEKVLSDTVLAVGDNKKNITKWVKTFPAIAIAPQSSLSILKITEDTGGKVYSNETLSMVASAIHHVILSSNFSVVERYLSRELPSFATLGYEARVNKEKNMDYRFRNPNDESFTLHFKMVDQKLYVSLTGAPFLYQYKVVLSDKESFKPKTVIQFDPKLSFGQYKIAAEGKDGQLVKVYRNILDDKGQKVKKELVSEDFYPPVKEVIVHSLIEKETVTTEDSNIDKSTADSSGDASDSMENKENANISGTTTDSSSSIETDQEQKKNDQDVNQKEDKASSLPDGEK
ncbi:G5 domain-containing protein [Niallia sp. 03133]|uniref:G5 domain-containing protein n=1 Tax=Niallia sp. 03133 TaxID=3458060 RepID=UPI004044D994